MHIKAKGIHVVVYEYTLKEAAFYHSRRINNLAEFKTECDVIIAKRMVDDIRDVTEKIYTRDLLGCD